MSSIFSKIIGGEIPGHFVWNDELCVVIMTIQPVRPGHILVIPKEEIDHWDDLPEALSNHLMMIAKKMAKALKKAFPAQRVGMIIAGLEVPHTHLHLIPIDSNNDFNMANVEFAQSEVLAAAALKIKQVL